ncbi:MAG: 16S rRNA (cytidine(1402)-2'-O)-methyltransferase [Candidatus Omnitrophica bacterium CG11_big_fil_rev_8_21_14_0_20_42_13]|uniref:Ribosomal RNA small subunit methyltransferase I n=1 Tax=Candidatus Ghiorseimicrobium undicola TaxID=1974746 RepID=A0A2H0LXH3_9BACT|nr:MAG: 16S rRNA (cytidine(1402)-2'-O)-methyltransferase [Candidatus Omnitrophica bacterium CG11_big_fil_rev_8_21_14_0_20_42_13]
MLYIVSTPIGNLKDITLRALETLKSVDLIACEDTRHTRILTNHYQVQTPLTSYYEHNKLSKGPYLLRLLKEGKDIALVSDAGTPGISDPGYCIIKLAKDNGVPITAVPGPCALINALVLSNSAAGKFIFEGFLPPKQQARLKKLNSLKGEERTIIFYESPHRIIRSLEDIFEVFGDIKLAYVREATKKFEETKEGTVSFLLEHFKKHPPRGEFVLIWQIPASLK